VAVSEPRHKTNLRHDCEKHGCYRDELWDWTPFNDCFGNSGIRISDVDGMVERNGLFLMLDGKRDGAPISAGQLRMYKQFALKGGHVIVFHGQPPVTVATVRQWLPGDDNVVGPTQCDLAGLKRIVADWYEWANGMRPIRSPLEIEIHAADPPAVDWPEVAKPGGGIEHLKGARWTG
jgi:hypothetical protein